MTSTKPTLTPREHVAQFDLLYSTLHGQYVRFLRWDDSFAAVVCDRDTLKELADYCHPTQLHRC